MQLSIVSVFLCCTCMVCIARCLHQRFYVWQEEKYRSRLAASISGQSFLSSADSLHSARTVIEMRLRHAPTTDYCRWLMRTCRCTRRDCHPIVRHFNQAVHARAPYGQIIPQHSIVIRNINNADSSIPIHRRRLAILMIFLYSTFRCFSAT